MGSWQNPAPSGCSCSSRPCQSQLGSASCLPAVVRYSSSSLYSSSSWYGIVGIVLHELLQCLGLGRACLHVPSPSWGSCQKPNTVPTSPEASLSNSIEVAMCFPIFPCPNCRRRLKDEMRPASSLWLASCHHKPRMHCHKNSHLTKKTRVVEPISAGFLPSQTHSQRLSPGSCRRSPKPKRQAARMGSRDSFYLVVSTKTEPDLNQRLYLYFKFYWLSKRHGVRICWS